MKSMRHQAFVHNYLFVLAFVLFVLQDTVVSIHSQNFKTCESNAFCKRLRGKDGPQYTASPLQPQSDPPTHASGTITVPTNNAQLNVGVSAYPGVFRLQIDEKAPNERYKLKGVLLDDLQQTQIPFKSVKQEGEWSVVELADSSLRIHNGVFQAEVIMNNQPVMKINERGKFHFEPRVQKTEADPSDWWSESFKQWTDDKVKGPQGISLDLTYPNFQHLFGIPVRAAPLSLKTTTGESPQYNEPYRLYNLDVFEHEDDSPFSLYGAIPLLIAAKRDAAVGVFWLNAAEQYVDVSRDQRGMQAQWISESGALDLFIITAPNVQQLIRQYSTLTGTMALPQQFSLGYHQCRWNYVDETDVLTVNQQFDAFALPYDVIWLDIEHTNGKRYLTWEGKAFPNPAQMQDTVFNTGRRTVVIVDPHMKVDDNYGVYATAKKQGYFIRKKDGGIFEGDCWPGKSSYLDMLNPKIRTWWGEQLSLASYKGSTKNLYIWNDMNEPSVFSGPEITMEKTNVHNDGTCDVEHRDVHNVYGMTYHQATAQGLIARGAALSPSGDRPFVLSRAFFAGSQRIGPIWTGDNMAQWSHVHLSVQMLLSLGMSGMPFVGADVGGFFGNPDAELLTRWYQLGVLYPFFRGHAHEGTRRREPYLFDQDTVRRVRVALRTRYALLPYIYTLSRHANLRLDPILRPLMYEFPDREDLYNVDYQAMLGSAILARPVTEAGAQQVRMVLPEQVVWYNFWTGVKSDSTPGGWWDIPVNMEFIPMYVKGGSIVPLRLRPRRSSIAAQLDPYTLLIALNDSHHATGDLYIDDGTSFDFLKGLYVHRLFQYNNGVLTSASYDNNSPPGDVPHASKVTIERIILLGLDINGSYDVTLPNGTNERAQLQSIWLQEGLPQVAIIIRNPQLRLDQDWQLTIQPAKQK